MIGIEYQIENNVLTILKIIPGSSADKAGLKPMDVITGINGISNFDNDLYRVEDIFKSLEDKPLNFNILRKDQTSSALNKFKELTFSLSRTELPIVNVSSEVLEFGSKKFGLISLKTFYDDKVCSLVKKELIKLIKSNVTGLILDLRKNLGGYSEEATCIAGLFVGRKLIATLKYWNDNFPKEYNSKEDKLTDLPLIVLIDSDSASSSELLAGALQDYKRAWTVGERTYGKGTFLVESIEFDGLLKINKPSGVNFISDQKRSNQTVGIIPNFEVPLRPDLKESARFNLREKQLYPNSIPLDSQQVPWHETRQNEVDQVNRCIYEKNNPARSYFYEQLKENNIAIDYQLKYSEMILDCMNEK